MAAASESRDESPKRSISARFVLAVVVPILLVMFTLPVVHYWRERRLVEDQIRLTALELGEVMRGSLHHAMLTNDRQMVAQMLESMSKMENIWAMQILDLEGRVKVHTLEESVGQVLRLDELGCIECHQLPPETRPRTVRLSRSRSLLRISTPIDNEPECTGCHTESVAHLGVLLADVSLINIEERLFSSLRNELLVTVGIALLLALVLQLVHYTAVRRQVALRDPLARLAAGDFSTRVSVSSGPIDELDRTAAVLNRLAKELEERAREQDERHALRERAIAEERDRIARELHDGLAQILGYVNTKAMAVRLMLKHGRTETAEQQLLQLEEAARGLSLDVREAILGLRITAQCGDDLGVRLGEFVGQFTGLSGLPVELSLSPEVEELPLTGEVQLQLCRIVQESLTNTRKHASATRAWVSLNIKNGDLVLVVRDNGTGFDPSLVATDHWSRLGLSMMRERVHTIGADLDLESMPGEGTRLAVRLPLEEQLAEGV